MKPTVRLGIAAVAGGVGALAFQPLGWWPVVLPAWAGFFLAVHGAGFRWGVRVGVVFGAVLYSCTLGWLWGIFGTLAPALWMVLALFAGLAGGLCAWLGGRRPGAAWLAPAMAAICLAAEHYMAEWFWLRFPWITPGVGLGPTWLSPLVGVYGASFLVVAAAACLVVGRGRTRGVGWGLAALVLALGVFRPGRVELGDERPSVPVLLLQSEVCNFTDAYETTAATDFRDGVVVWPEYTISYDILRFGKNEFGRLRDWAGQRQAVMVIGTWQGDGNQSSAKEENFNTALTLDGNGELGRHAKCRPVHFFNDGSPGRLMLPVATPRGMVGTPICFDCDYVEVVRRMTAAGAEWFAVPSMDAAGWGERQHLQHQELFRQRALENGRWMAVAATSGRTWVLDPHGVPHGQLPLFEGGVLRGSVAPRSGMTFFTRAGWLTPWVLSALALVALAAGLVPRRPRATGDGTTAPDGPADGGGNG